MLEYAGIILACKKEAEGANESRLHCLVLNQEMGDNGLRICVSTKGGDEMMKKSLFVISIIVVLAITVGGCATKRDLAKVQSQEMLTSAKADQAVQDSQAAKASADAATLKAEAAAARAEDAVKKAEEREKIAEEKARIAEEKTVIAEEKAKKADEAFRKSMKK